MPIVTMPLCSLGANGTIARRHTFYPKAGKTVLRQRVQPSNPGTSPQAAMRGVHALTTHLIRWAAASLQTSDGHYMTDKERIEQVTPMARRWVGMLYSKALQDEQANVRGALGQWAMLSPADAAAWEAAALALSPPIAGLTANTAPPATPATFSPGATFFVWRYLLFLLRVCDTPPTATPPTYS